MGLEPVIHYFDHGNGGKKSTDQLAKTNCYICLSDIGNYGPDEWEPNTYIDFKLLARVSSVDTFWEHMAAGLSDGRIK